MNSNAKTVDEYIDAFSGSNRDLLQQLKRSILDAAPGAVESMKYKMPTYNIGRDVFAFAIQKNYISVYVNKDDVISKHASRIGRHSRGKNCIRYSKPEHVDLSGLAALINAAYGKSA